VMMDDDGGGGNRKVGSLFCLFRLCLFIYSNEFFLKCSFYI
jgi:hypothetical protein